MPSAAVVRANTLPLADLSPDLPINTSLQCTSRASFAYTTSLARPAQIPRTLKDDIWTIYEFNMVPLTTGTSLFSPKDEKWEELFEESTVFVLMTTDGTGEEPQSTAEEHPQTTARIAGGRLIAFASFRFDEEEDLQGKPLDVVYIYEMQIHRDYRHLRLASILLERAESIGRTAEMKAGILTCLKNNLPGLAFYRKHNYTPDEIDPTRIEIFEHRAKIARMLNASRTKGGGGRGKTGAGKPKQATRNQGTAVLARSGPVDNAAETPYEADSRWWLSSEEEPANVKGPDYRILSKWL